MQSSISEKIFTSPDREVTAVGFDWIYRNLYFISHNESNSDGESHWSLEVMNVDSDITATLYEDFDKGSKITSLVVDPRDGQRYIQYLPSFITSIKKYF